MGMVRKSERSLRLEDESLRRQPTKQQQQQNNSNNKTTTIKTKQQHKKQQHNLCCIFLNKSIKNQIFEWTGGINFKNLNLTSKTLKNLTLSEVASVTLVSVITVSRGKVTLTLA
jgi:hypothetical protein